MSQTKLEIFKIKISENSKFDFDKKVLEAINNFLNEENTVYVNHSTSILTEDIEEYGTNKTVNKYLVVTLIYKDLNASQFDLKNTNKKVKSVVKKEIEKGENIPEPKIETDLEKEIRQLTKPIRNAGLIED
ncbi:hypothetical protein LA303_07705 [Candidatus Sulfidibacterium hydrothermale]|uniref:hypothetical protein n=1 Tax=Candidatus Sulfidibacterium hydrothermale TaxID=2875962 RepID=UPI001F0B185B|nr:hypothetical protein [Candidatus Sulfidibacterium hydrothermale]UBM61307.1 hypothetical protein LA303_07705 [Candidatus Sulfidibacterium hydrothermale]